jgi:hypothetical protein
MVLAVVLAALALLVGGPILIGWILLHGKKRPHRNLSKTARGTNHRSSCADSIFNFASTIFFFSLRWIFIDIDSA